MGLPEESELRKTTITTAIVKKLVRSDSERARGSPSKTRSFDPEALRAARDVDKNSKLFHSDWRPNLRIMHGKIKP